MEATIVVDVSDADKLCKAAVRQLPFALSRAINATAKSVRDTMLDELRLRFIIRKQQFARRAIDVTQMSNKNQTVIQATVSTVVPFPTQSRDVFGKFEEGGRKVAANPYFPNIIPTPSLRRSPTSLPPMGMYPSRLGLTPVRSFIGNRAPKWHKTASGKTQIKGANRTFVLGDSGDRYWGVYRRTGKRTIKRIWIYRSVVPIPKRLGFRSTATAVVERVWQANFEDAFAQAIQTAR